MRAVIEFEKINLWKLATALSAAFAAFYLFNKSVHGSDFEVDFRFIWLAGKAWSLGSDPYGPAFAQLARQYYPTGNVANHWLYPPQWWLPCRLLAILPPRHALTAWRIVNAGLAFSSTAMLALGVWRSGITIPRWLMIVFPLYGCLMYAAALTLSYGQTSIVVMFGMSLWAYAWLAKSETALVIGLTLCCFKPQFGMPLCLGLLANRTNWRPLLLSGLLSVMLALPHILSFGVAPTLKKMAENLSIHAALLPNLPPNMTGLAFLLDLLGIHISPSTLMLILAIAIFIIIFIRRKLNTKRQLIATIVIINSMSCFILPLHSYDMCVLVPSLFLAWFLNKWTATAFAVTAAILFRPAMLARLFGPAPLLPSGSTLPEIALISVATAIAMAGLVAALVIDIKRSKAAPA